MFDIRDPVAQIRPAKTDIRPFACAGVGPTPHLSTPVLTHSHCLIGKSRPRGTAYVRLK